MNEKKCLLNVGFPELYVKFCQQIVRSLDTIFTLNSLVLTKFQLDVGSTRKF